MTQMTKVLSIRLTEEPSCTDEQYPVVHGIDLQKESKINYTVLQHFSIIIIKQQIIRFNPFTTVGCDLINVQKARGLNHCCKVLINPRINHYQVVLMVVDQYSTIIYYHEYRYINLFKYPKMVGYIWLPK